MVALQGCFSGTGRNDRTGARLQWRGYREAATAREMTTITVQMEAPSIKMYYFAVAGARARLRLEGSPHIQLHRYLAGSSHEAHKLEETQETRDQMCFGCRDSTGRVRT